jgi:hypothetical protein
MLASSKPHSFQAPGSSTMRPARTPSHPPISYPLDSSRPASQSSTSLDSTQSQRSSRQNLMHWLSRHSTQSSISSSKSAKQPEQKPIRSIELLSTARSGALGSGATIVRTPQDALRASHVRTSVEGESREELCSTPESTGSHSRQSRSSTSSRRADERKPSHYPSSLPIDNSPPLPPVPLPEEESAPMTPSYRDERASLQPPRPTRDIPPPPSPKASSSVRSSLKLKLSHEDEHDRVPPLPTYTPASSKPPPFDPILLSELPHSGVDRSRLIITLETCTTTFKTTFKTLTSRPSHLAEYLTSLPNQSPRISAASSVYSTESDTGSAYPGAHQGPSHGVSNMILFLDRPSAP